jgi:hypothetical protein
MRRRFQHNHLSVKAIKYYAKAKKKKVPRQIKRSRNSVSKADSEYLEAWKATPKQLTRTQKEIRRHGLWLTFFFPWVKSRLRVGPPLRHLMYANRLKLPTDVINHIKTFIYRPKHIVHVPYEYSKKLVLQEINGVNYREKSILRYTTGHMISLPSLVFSHNPYEKLHRMLDLHLKMKLLYMKNIKPWCWDEVDNFGSFHGPLPRYDDWGVHMTWETMQLVDI